MKYKMNGTELTSDGHRVGTVKPGEITDAGGHRVGRVRGDDILDKSGSRVARVRGDDILDASGSKIGSLRDARKAIDGAAGGVTVAALWYFFVR